MLITPRVFCQLVLTMSLQCVLVRDRSAPLSGSEKKAPAQSRGGCSRRGESSGFDAAAHGAQAQQAQTQQCDAAGLRHLRHGKLHAGQVAAEFG